jgi:hypothetical protein
MEGSSKFSCFTIRHFPSLNKDPLWIFSSLLISAAEEIVGIVRLNVNQ